MRQPMENGITVVTSGAKPSEMLAAAVIGRALLDLAIPCEQEDAARWLQEDAPTWCRLLPRPEVWQHRVRERLSDLNLWRAEVD